MKFNLQKINTRGKGDDILNGAEVAVRGQGFKSRLRDESPGGRLKEIPPV